MGLRSFSMHPGCVAAIKQRVLRADAGRLAGVLAHVLEAEEPQHAAVRHFEPSGTAPIS
jgi:phosphotransferase system enzyme I (PtsI)